MFFTLLACLAAFLCLFLYLLQQRMALAQMKHDVNEMRQKIQRVVSTRYVPQGLRVENRNFIIEEYRIEEG